MLNWVCKIRFRHGKCSRFQHLSSSQKLFFLHRFSSLAGLESKDISENATEETFPTIYLRKKFGLTEEKVSVYSKYFKIESSKRPDAVVTFLKNHNFKESQIRDLVKRNPRALLASPESTFLPKIEFFRSIGFTSSETAKVLSMVPLIMSRSMEDQIIPFVQFLRSFLSSDDNVKFSLMRCPWLMLQSLHNTILPNIELLRKTGVPENNIKQLLKNSPRTMALSPSDFHELVLKAEKLKLNPNLGFFIRGIRVIRALSSSTWNEKVEVFKTKGWSEQQVLEAFRLQPLIMSLSKVKIDRMLDFFRSKTSFDPLILIRRPNLLTLGFEKTVIPRSEFYDVLLSKGLINEGFNLLKMFECPRKEFLERYVLRYSIEAPELLKLYQKRFGSLKGADISTGLS